MGERSERRTTSSWGDKEGDWSEHRYGWREEGGQHDQVGRLVREGRIEREREEREREIEEETLMLSSEVSEIEEGRGVDGRLVDSYGEGQRGKRRQSRLYAAAGR